jgi:hypothetical protein
MTRFSLLLIGVVFQAGVSAGQQLKGSVTDDLGNVVHLASVVVRHTDSTGHVLGYAIARDGTYLIRVAEKAYQLGVEVRAAGYRNSYLVLTALHPDSLYQQNFVLYRVLDKELSEVVIEAKKDPFKVKKDTVVFDVDGYRDATTRKVADVIKKLPGMEVNETTGEIRYNGKSIETVTIEGDNLFGSNYAMATRNINADVVAQIEAIEKYSDNVVLKGLEESDKVALNLKLKKGKTDVSGAVEAGAGAEKQRELHLVNANVLSVSHRLKSFSVLSSNNIGLNNSPFNHFNKGYTPEAWKDRDFVARRILSDPSAEILDDSRSNVNSQFFVSHNASMKFSRKWSGKVNLYYLDDRRWSRQIFKSTNMVNGQNITWQNDYTTRKNPTLSRVDGSVVYHPSVKSLLEYDFKLKSESIGLHTDVRTAASNDSYASLRTEDLYLKQNLLFTRRLNNSQAIQWLVTHAMNEVPQRYTISPAVLKPEKDARDRQTVTVTPQTIVTRFTLLGANRVGKYTFSLGANWKMIPLVSSLTGVDSSGVSIESSRNHVNYTRGSFYQHASYSVQLKKWKVTPSYSLSLLKQRHHGGLRRKSLTTQVLFEPSLSIMYSINTVSSLLLKAGYYQRPLVESYTFSNRILTNNRTIQTNEPDLALQRGASADIFYLIQDLYSQLRLEASLSYSRSTGDYFDFIDVTEDFTNMNFVFLERPASEYSGNLNVSKFVGFLSTTFQAGSRVSGTRYWNTLNDSELRENTAITFQSEVGASTSFDAPINFSNSFTFTKSQSTSSLGKNLSNTFWSNESSVSIRFKKDFLLTSSLDYSVPATSSGMSFCFLDAGVSWKPGDKHIEIQCLARNLLDVRRYSRVEVSDYATSGMSTNVIPRYFLLHITYQF